MMIGIRLEYVLNIYSEKMPTNVALKEEEDSIVIGFQFIFYETTRFYSVYFRSICIKMLLISLIIFRY